jgi:putative colanic acid biosynthesis UDP-glucose lipid carrier transferase
MADPDAGLFMEGGPATSPLQVRKLELDGQFRADVTGERLRPFAPEIRALPLSQSVPTLRDEDVYLKSFYFQRGKRFFDIVFSAAFLLLIGIWMYPLIGIAIRLDSQGPVFFRQKRIGLGGETFTCLKFRTMTHDPDAGFMQAQKNDARITRVGALLRRTNLDEIPQFLNVLIGDMSVIGPRPHVPELDTVFKDVVPLYGLRNTVKPGVSGLAQVSGCRGETRSVREMSHRVRFDLFYCRNVGFAMDLKLIALTVIRALRGDERAY